MLTNETFSITFKEFIPDVLGTASMIAVYTANYYKDNKSRGTMCCNCDKTEIPPA